MSQLIFNWGNFRKSERQIETLCTLGFLLAAIVLFCINLGELPLRDWDEGIVAQVAKEIWRAPLGSWHWLYPTFNGDPYLNKPTLMHLLIAWMYSIAGVNEWTARLPGAILTAISVPLLYKVGREIFPRRLPAIFAALIYLTLIPVVRHGRLAMLDGAVLCFLLLMILFLLKSRRDLRYCLGVGIGLALIWLTKGILGLLLGAIALLFLFWDTPRLLTSFYFWTGLLIGSIPIAGWYASQLLHHGQTYINNSIVAQSFQRVWTSVENHQGPPWYYLQEILELSWPWLLFLPQSFRYVWENRNLSWAKLVLVWSSVYLLAISIMTTKLPWYVLSVYPALALGIGAYLAEIWHWPSNRSYPRAWIGILGLLAIVGWAGSIYFGLFSPTHEPDLILILVAVALTMTIAAILAIRRDVQFLIILFWGMYVSLILLMCSEHWVWELAESYPVKPVAAMIRASKIPVIQQIFTSYPHTRPSLNFYSDRQIIPASPEMLKQIWQQETQPYFLLKPSEPQQLGLDNVKTLGNLPDWTLITHKQLSVNSYQ